MKRRITAVLLDAALLFGILPQRTVYQSLSLHFVIFSKAVFSVRDSLPAVLNILKVYTAFVLVL